MKIRFGKFMKYLLLAFSTILMSACDQIDNEEDKPSVNVSVTITNVETY